MITYRIEDKIYINLTNRCSNSCDFCVRNHDSYKDYALWLEKEPTAEEVIAELTDISDYREVVFCGYGEPLYRMGAMIRISEYVHKCGKPTRLNTNGQAKFIVGEGAAQKLKGYIDTVSISLNASSPERYQAICHSEFGEEAFGALISFATECKKEGMRVILSIVDIVGEEEVERAKRLARALNIELRVRAYIP